MKKIYSIFLMIFSMGSVVLAQQASEATFLKMDERHADDIKLEMTKKDRPASATESGTEAYWLSYPAAVEIAQGISSSVWPTILWPDSNVVLTATDGSGHFHWWIHGMASTFNPVSENLRIYLELAHGVDYQDAQEWYTRDRGFEIDSMAFYYYYQQRIPSVDTLRVYILHHGSGAFNVARFLGTTHPSIPEGDTLPFSIVGYDYPNNRPAGTNLSVVDVLLTETDTAWFGSPFGVKEIPVGLYLPPRADPPVVGVAFEYIPGHSYNFGDTLREQTGSTPVTNELNEFRLMMIEEVENQFPVSWEDRSHNIAHGLLIHNRYNNADGWNGRYIPAYAYTSTRRNHIHMQWRVRAEGAHYTTPTTDFRTGTAVEFFDESNVSSISWNWNFGDGNTSTAQNPTHTYADRGTYDVCLTTNDGTRDFTFCRTYEVQWPVGIELIEPLSYNRIYPNPTSGNATIEYEITNQAEVNISIKDITGRVVFELNEGNQSAGAYTKSLNLNHLPNGVYMYELKINDEMTTNKLIINR